MEGVFFIQHYYSVSVVCIINDQMPSTLKAHRKFVHADDVEIGGFYA